MTRREVGWSSSQPVCGPARWRTRDLSRSSARGVLVFDISGVVRPDSCRERRSRAFSRGGSAHTARRQAKAGCAADAERVDWRDAVSGSRSRDLRRRPASGLGHPVAELLIARTLDRVVRQGMRAFPEVFATAPGAREIKLVGLDPARVLVIGSGLALGWGASSQQTALTGALAQKVQERTGRGAIVVNRAQELQQVDQTVTGLGMVGATGFGTVVWCPSLFDVIKSPERGRYHRALLQGLHLLRETAPSSGITVLCALPVPTRRGPIEEIARRLVPRFNAALRRIAEPFPDVYVCDSPSFTSLADHQAFSHGYYQQWAELILAFTEGQRHARTA